VSASWGLHTATGKALGAAWADYNNSGKQSLAIANDEVAGDLMRNHGRNFKTSALHRAQPTIKLEMCMAAWASTGAITTTTASSIWSCNL
jgi:hypothetical protein